MPERTAHGASIREALKDAADRLAAAGLPRSRREATMLWAAVAGAGTKPGDVWLQQDQEPAVALVERFWRAVERRSSGVPFAYAVGRTGFRTLDLQLDARALIPRPETEGLVDLVLRTMRETGHGKRETWGAVADIGTGCGCIALALAVEGDFERVIAVERSADAAALARENVALVRPPVPVEVREGDLLAPLAGQRYRAIVSNPPYLTEAEHAELDPAVRLFEPREALVSGVDGLTATRALLAGARALLAPGGFVALEIDERRADAVRALALRHDWSRVAVYDDLFGRPRFLLAGIDEEGGT
ncbi:MAG TPA: peptide chain release factor N(5)-glutamine methyltransferase [Gemmatimonadales bacterium]|nr:peptide chain release factor N(5)-glutamine methyltransferase [Gemmatimonadales bacterium]